MITSMMQDVHVNLNLGLPWKMKHSKKKKKKNKVHFINKLDLNFRKKLQSVTFEA
jgi:hypothetical protein